MNPLGYLETGVLYCGDNLQRLSLLPSESVDLIYLDPPFFSNRNYEVISGDEAEVRSFQDRWEGGIHVIEWMRDVTSVYESCEQRNVRPIIPLRKTPAVKSGKAGPPS